ncbi:alpha/beta hydrolase [Lentilactobacillus diolivorans]|uniref:Esterase n=2 Tax=Lentilactobacillus diolivorans TaxID=179838 RepID=A0A0R1SGI6_9LACO|nr:alpha/beta hydrolase [Lentilactobacillus diolivorans]KRL65522.1 esterase [Lentilactobacillus diolivorans DSM 14421]GEP24180.1 hypothetical protein LDI01_17730 [Lentilactobacillus diolivorans]
MKFSTKLLIAGLSTGLGYEKAQALQEQRSLRSRLTEKTLPFIQVVPVIKNQADYQNALAKSAQHYRLPSIVEKLYDFHPTQNGSDVLELNPAIKKVSGEVIFYIHGGGYWGQPLIPHFNMLHQLANKLGSRIVLPIYPKAPAYKATDAYEMVLSAYQELLDDEHVDPQRITFMGDSAGGGLALALMQKLRDDHLSLPKRAVLLSPWLDVTNSNPKMSQIQPVDPMLDLKNLTRLGRGYIGDLDSHDPLASPIYGDSSELPSIYVFTGTHDILNADALKFQRLADQNDWNVTTFNYQKMNHVFSVFPIPEGTDSLNRIVHIIQSSDDQ